MVQISEQIFKIGIIPVIAIDDAEKAVPLAKALVKGGLPAAEVTFRTTCAAECIAAMAEAEPEMCVGAGTVLTVEQVEQARAAGAKFIVSPGYSDEVVAWCVENGVKYFSVASGGGTGRTLHPDNMAAGPASYGMTDTMGRMHSDAQFAGSSSVPAHVEMMGLIGMGNNPMVGATVACAVAVEEANK